MHVAIGSSLLMRWLLRLAALTVLLAALGGGALAAHLAVLGNELPDVAALEVYRPDMTSKVFDRGGNLLASFYQERRTVVPIASVPKHVKNAFLAAEDEDFYTHKGIDYLAIARCALNRVRGGVTCGGSTITQQTAKTFLLTNERTLDRKLKEMLLTKRIEERFSKDQILHLYLNQIYFGNGAYGIEEAARTYYGRGVDKITIAQAAVLASIPKSPSRINPWADPKRVRQRRGYVLQQMLSNGMITDAEMAVATQEPIRVDVAPPEFLNEAPYYADAVRQQLLGHLSADDVNRDGLSVYAAVDGKLQRAANQALDLGLREVDKRQGYRGPLARLDPDEARSWLAALQDERSRRFPADETPQLATEPAAGRPIWDLSAVRSDDIKRVLQSQRDPQDDLDEHDDHPPELRTRAPMRTVRTTKLVLGDVVGGVVRSAEGAARGATIDLGTLDAWLPVATAQWARTFSPAKATDKPKQISDVLRVGDVVLVRLDKIVPATAAKPARLEVSLEQDPLVQGALVAMDAHNHRVLAMVGGVDQSRGGLNRATQSFRQAGSSFKPFVYGTAIESHRFSAVGSIEKVDGGTHHRLLTDAPKVFFDRWTNQRWQPSNSGGRFLGDITLRTCLTHSVNTCSITLVEALGVDAVLDTAKRAGLSTPQHAFPANLTLALGTGEVRPIDLVNAYTSFVNGGKLGTPILVEKVKRADGAVVVLPAPPPGTQLFSPETAYVMADMMRSVVENGTAMRARELGRPVGGKTGTTNEARSVWFVGFTPDVVTGVYVGFDDNTPLGANESGGRAAVPIWMSFMKAATAGLPVHDFQPPAGVVRKAVDATTGLLAQSGEALGPGELPAAVVADPDADPIPAVLPVGILAEAFISGTEPTQTAADAPPPPLELQEQGGLAP
jgi:penicillin-binding protein 1A